MENTYELAPEVAGLIKESKRLIVFSGAGISTESGIPDFRGPGGIWQKFDPDDFTYKKFINDASSRRRQWQLFRQLATTVEPNPAHYAVAALHRMGKLDCVVTQNIDNLHQSAGVPAEKVLELHGSMREMVCLSCGRRYSAAQVIDRLETEEVPDCEQCRGILKPNVVFFGEQLPQGIFNKAAERAGRCDLLIAIGSTLTVYPAAYIPEYALDAGAKLVIINLSSTPLDKQAAVLAQAKAGEFMTQVMQKINGS